MTKTADFGLSRDTCHVFLTNKYYFFLNSSSAVTKIPLQLAPSGRGCKLQCAIMTDSHNPLSTLYLLNSADALEGAAARDPPGQSSPMGDRKKNRRKKSMNQKGDAAVGQAEGSSRAKDLLRDFLSSPPPVLELVFSPSPSLLPLLLLLLSLYFPLAARQPNAKCGS